MNEDQLASVQNRFAGQLSCFVALELPPSSFDVDEALERIFDAYRPHLREPTVFVDVPSLPKGEGAKLLEFLKSQQSRLAYVPLLVKSHQFIPESYEVVAAMIVTSGLPESLLVTNKWRNSVLEPKSHFQFQHDKLNRRLVAIWSRRLVADYDRPWIDDIARAGRSTRSLLADVQPVLPKPDPLKPTADLIRRKPDGHSGTFTLVDYRDENAMTSRQIWQRQSHLDFLCMVTRANRAEVDISLALNWIRGYRAQELEIAHLAFERGEQSLAPISIIVVTDPTPTEMEHWRRDCRVRDQLARLGVIILDRPDDTGTQASDQELLLQTISSLVPVRSIRSSTNAQRSNLEWTLAHPTSKLAKAFGRQPSTVDPHPDDTPNAEADILRRFESYSGDDPESELDY